MLMGIGDGHCDVLLLASYGFVHRGNVERILGVDTS